METYPLGTGTRKPHPCWSKRYPPRVRALLSDGMVVNDCHFAEDLSGEEQPAFSGWFIPSGSHGFRQAEGKRPMFWQPCTAR